MLKNELERTTFDNSVADWTDWTEVDHTQSFSKALHKGHIRIQAKCKQATPNLVLQLLSMLSMCPSVFINTAILLNKVLLVIAWRQIHIHFCRYVDPEVSSSVSARKKSSMSHKYLETRSHFSI